MGCISGAVLVEETRRMLGEAGFTDVALVSIPIAICLVFMMFPIMVKICLKTKSWFR